MPHPIEWQNGRLALLDQTKLPAEESLIITDDYRDVASAIKTLSVRGAPAIGAAAAYGLALVAAGSDEPRAPEMLRELKDAAEVLAATRPTAVNLFTALNRVMKAEAEKPEAGAMRKAVIAEAEAIFRETGESDRELSRLGAEAIQDGDTIMTICNTGALATGGYGTALGVIRAAWESGKEIKVIACETRPLLQGARLTMWELDRYGIPGIQIVDSAAAHYMKHKGVNKVIAGADRIAANGDTANKIGTYSLACLAARHYIPFFIAAPTSTIDLSTKSGEHIAIEERSQDEVTSFAGIRVSPADAEAGNPAFDVTPAELITAIITERGILKAPYEESLAAV
jgi:methylthioribose-1-phosphate isomerase